MLLGYFDIDRLGRDQKYGLESFVKRQTSFKQAFYTTSEGYLLNNILPFRLGEVARSMLMSEKIGIPFFEVFSTVVIEQLLDLIFAVSILLISVSFVVGAGWAIEISSGVGIIVLSVLVVLYIIALRREQVLAFLLKLTQSRPKLQRFSGNQIGAFFNGLSVITEPRQFIQIIFYMTLDWFFGILQFYVIMKAFFPQAGILEASFTLGVAALGMQLLIPGRYRSI